MARLSAEDFGDMSQEGERVRQRRERLGMDKKALAEEAGINRNTLAAIEGGESFGRRSLAKIDRALDRLEEEAGIGAPPMPRTADEGREGYDERTQAFLDLLGAYLMRLPEGERLERIFAMTRYLILGGGPEPESQDRG